MTEDLFRKSSFERLSSPEQLDRLLVVVGSKGWLALFVLIALIAILVAWAFTATIPIQISTPGIVNSPSGFAIVRSTVTGSVDKIYVSKGQSVTAGEPLLSLTNGDVTSGLAMRRIEAAMLESDIAALTAQSQMQQTISEQILQGVAEIRGSLKAPATGADPLQQLGLATVQLSIQEVLARLVQELGAERRQTLRLRLSQATVLLQKLQAEADALVVKAPGNGNVVQVDVSPQDYATPGDQLVSISQPLKAGEKMLLFGYIPLDTAGVIEPGQLVDATILDSGPQQGLTFKGRVTYVSPYSLSQAELLPNLLYLKESALLPDEWAHVIEVRIEPDLASLPALDAAGQPVTAYDLLLPGEICNLNITIARKKPWQYVIP